MMSEYEHPKRKAAQRYNLIVFQSAAIVNTLGVFILTKGLNAPILEDELPQLFGSFGLVSIMVWGLAYWSCRYSASFRPSIGVVFAIEKSLYVFSWVTYMWKNPPLSSILKQDFLSGLFLSIYGVVDFLYLCLFLWSASLAWELKLPEDEIDLHS